MAVSVRNTSTAAPRRGSHVLPVRAWAVFGGLCLAFMAFVWAKWLTGPYATSVSAGPDREPGWMHTTQLVWQTLSVPAMLATFYWFLARPWLRERRLSSDGLLCVGFLLLWFQDTAVCGLGSRLPVCEGLGSAGWCREDRWEREVSEHQLHRGLVEIVAWCEPGHDALEPVDHGVFGDVGAEAPVGAGGVEDWLQAAFDVGVHG
jgi:hypothetical protein